MLKRKIENKLSEWKNLENKKPLILRGLRQCGKTFSVMNFAKNNYEHIIYLNFFENPNYATAFSGSLETDNIIMQISAMIGKKAVFKAGKTVLILDEIQECPEARTALKFFCLDGRFDIIATGSLSGVRGYGKAPKSIPVGYETSLEMYPLDFEEFLWANEIPEEIIEVLKNRITEVKPVPDALHQRMRQLLFQYTVVGGMPEAVNAFVKTKQINTVLAVQKDIIRSYEDDMLKHAQTTDKSKIVECFKSVPRQLARENKKFKYSEVKKGGSASKYTGSLQRIEDAGIITRCFNLETTELPFSGYCIDDVFKVYMSDTGLFSSMLEDGTSFDILNGKLYAYKGAIFENLIADIFYKMGRKLYYFRKDSGLEIDFLIRYKGNATAVEVKAVNGNAKSLKTVLKNKEKYHLKNAIKLGDYNIGKINIEEAEVLTLPLYAAFLLREV
ncbi:ATP-binding protein [Treponema pedis]|uniref:ATP/GTP-binding protein n=1 Tax=Treponema pedis str. T A4 TaxID=1291379 RepID=S6A984_9SPIR|nr:ATP-binding protein [Treponema pedis]AGT45129.1 ATP/GTP-binding protein [Treponema pedis str. T A4]